MKGTLCLLTFFAIFCLFIVNVSAQDTERSAFADIMPEPGKKKEVKFPNRPVVLPEGVSALQYCITCRAVTKELMNRLGYEVRPTAIAKARENLCEKQHYENVKEFSAEEIVNACNHFVKDYENELFVEMFSRVQGEDTLHRLCRQRTRICRGVQFEGKPPKKPKDAQEEGNSESVPEAPPVNVKDKGADYIEL